MSNFATLFGCFSTRLQVVELRVSVGPECNTAGKQTIIADIIIYSLRLILAIPSILQYNAIISSF